MNPASLTLYGAAASGSVAVEAALTLLGLPYALIEGATWAEAAARERVAPANAMRQIPTLVLEGGEVMTESAAILIYLADLHPEARLAPLPATRGAGSSCAGCCTCLPPSIRCTGSSRM